MEMYYVAAWAKKSPHVSYTNGGHGMPTSTVEEVKDYHQRILDWYNDHRELAAKRREIELNVCVGLGLSGDLP